MPLRSSSRTTLAVIAALALLPISGCAAAVAPPTTHSAAPSASPTPSASQMSTPSNVHADAAFAGLESTFDARLGVYAIDTGSIRTIGYRDDERFPYASTYKALAAGTILQQSSDADLDSVVRYTADDLVTHSPITEEHVDTGMTQRELCDAAVRYSDNTAGNMLFKAVGGPSGLNAELKKLGDDVTHVDRLETDLNEAVPGDIRDTSTPRALATDLREFALGDALPARKRTILTDWMRGNTTGDATIRAGVPPGWTVGDKTGTADSGTRNDIAVIWPSNGAPIVLAILSTRPTTDAPTDDALLAQATTIAIDALKPNR